MRILHTSDWHLGQYFIGKSRAREHQAFFDWLLEQITTHRVDALLVAGDIFDTATPPSYARELYNGFVVALQATGCRLVILGGNHDSVATLSESRSLFACLNTTVVPGVLPEPEQQVITLPGRDGAAGAVLGAVPFIRPRDVMTSQAGQSGTDKQHLLQRAIADHYQGIYDEAQAQASAAAKPLPVILTGHLTTVGASTSESVREIYIGTLEAFPASAFPPADYVALGHIHKPQQVGGNEHIRYSGSPIPLSFDEINQDKQVLMVDFADGKLSSVTPLTVPRFQPMAVVKGDLAAIESSLAQLATQYSQSLPVWVDVLVSTQDYLTDLQRRLQDLVKDKPVEVLMLRRERQQLSGMVQQEARETLSELTVREVFERRLAQEDWPDEADQQRRQRLITHFDAAVERIRSNGSAPVAESQQGGSDS